MKNKILIGIVAVLIAITGWFAHFLPHPVGSVNDGQGYYSTTTVVGNATTGKTTPFVVRAGPGLLGSVVVTTTSNSVVKFFDHPTATTTSVDGTGSVGTSTLLMSFPANAVVGTYQFDLQFTKGLVVDLPGYSGSYTITYK